MASSSEEIIAGPYEVWVAPVGTAFPNVDTAPAGPWVLLGANGSKNQDESGVVLTLSQTIVEWRPAGSTLPRAAFRTQEGLMIECKLADLSAATFAKVMNDATVVTAGATTVTPATSTVPLKRGSSVALNAVLVRGLGPTPATSAFNAQFQIPAAYESASKKPGFAKGAPALLDVQFELLEDDTADPELVIQTGAHS